jgi:hypothetical protein
METLMQNLLAQFANSQYAATSELTSATTVSTVATTA